MILTVAFLLGLAGFTSVVVFEQHAAGMLLTGLSLGMIVTFLPLRRGAR